MIVQDIRNAAGRLAARAGRKLIMGLLCRGSGARSDQCVALSYHRTGRLEGAERGVQMMSRIIR